MTLSDSTAERDTWSAAGDPFSLHHLDHLRINIRGGTTHHPGQNPVSNATQDSGLEFVKHRPYAPGDDLRHIDWNALARHDTKLVKMFRAEREAPLHILIDSSASMGCPSADNKHSASFGIAQALAYISLRNRDPVHVAVFDANGARPVAPLLRHPERLELLITGLNEVTPTGPTDLSRGVESYLQLTRLPGIAVVISDFLVENDNYERALSRFRANGYAVAAIRPIGPLEREPAPQTRRVRLYDIESRKERIVDLTPSQINRYKRALEQHSNQLQSFCASTGVQFCAIDTAAPASTSLTHVLPRAGILR